MKTDRFGQMVFSQDDLFDLVMQGHRIDQLKQVLVDDSVSAEQINQLVDCSLDFVPYDPEIENLTVEEFDKQCQQQWLMPAEYQDLDIAEYVLSLCNTQEQLQRCGHELLLYQQKGWFDLLKYLKYLVDVMKENNIIWGVGRGSSVASYVLYKLQVHRVDSMYYDLEPEEFLR